MKKISITVAIPAYNEEANIAHIIKNILQQKAKTFVLEKILVVTDGCTDNTNKIVKKLASTHKRIELLSYTSRKGKVSRLNKIYSLNHSTYLFIFDADISIPDRLALEKAVNVFEKNKNIQIIAFHQIPIKPHTFIGNIIHAGYEMWDRARLSIINQDHIQNLYGAATGYRSKFAKTFRYPKDITDDRGYLYAMSKIRGGFYYTFASVIYYLPVSTLHDFWKLSDRSFGNNIEVLKKVIGPTAENMYVVPKMNILWGMLITILKNPFYAIGAIILNIAIRLFPLHDDLYKVHMWEISKSTKKNLSKITH